MNEPSKTIVGLILLLAVAFTAVALFVETGMHRHPTPTVAV